MLSRLRTTYTLEIKPLEPGHGQMGCGPAVGAAPTLYMLAPAHARGSAMSDLINVLLQAYF